MPWHSLAWTSSPVPIYLSPDGFSEMEQDDPTKENRHRFRAMLPQEPIQPSPKSQYCHEEAESSPWSYRYLMLRYLMNQPKVTTINIANSESDFQLSSFVEFCIKGRDSPWSGLCRWLPATQLFLVVAKWTGNDVGASSLSHRLQNAKSVWTELGNRENPLETSTFRVSLISGTSPRGRRRNQSGTRKPVLSSNPSPGDTSIQRDPLATNAIDVATCLSQTMGWEQHKGKDKSKYPTFSFHLRLERHVEDGRDVHRYSLELLVLDRLWPLPDASRKTVNTKRIESFVVAKSAKIEPGQVVWDPFCQRGTFLVEAAKFWPTAAYHGSDCNLGHLEHAQMNACSTLTRLFLHHVVAAPEQAQRSVDQLQESLGGSAVDKILTRLPSDRSVSFYQRLLHEWSRVLRQTGSTLVLLVDVPNTLDALKLAVQHLSEIYSIAFIRSPSFVLGNRRCTVVILRHHTPRQKDTRTEQDDTIDDMDPKGQGTRLFYGGPAPTLVGLLDWELEALQGSPVQPNDGTFSNMWSQVRAQTIPWMVPYTSRSIPSTRIQLVNGKFV